MASRLVSRRSMGGDTKPVPPTGEEEKKKRLKTKRRKGNLGQSKVSPSQRKMIGGMQGGY